MGWYKYEYQATRIYLRLAKKNMQVIHTNIRQEIDVIFICVCEEPVCSRMYWVLRQDKGKDS